MSAGWRTSLGSAFLVFPNLLPDPLRWAFQKNDEVGRQVEQSASAAIADLNRQSRRRNEFQRPDLPEVLFQVSNKPNPENALQVGFRNDARAAKDLVRARGSVFYRQFSNIQYRPSDYLVDIGRF